TPQSATPPGLRSVRKTPPVIAMAGRSGPEDVQYRSSGPLVLRTMSVQKGRCREAAEDSSASSEPAPPAKPKPGERSDKPPARPSAAVSSPAASENPVSRPAQRCPAYRF